MEDVEASSVNVSMKMDSQECISQCLLDHLSSLDRRDTDVHKCACYLLYRSAV